MFLRQFDFLSPRITLYFKGKRFHKSIASGIITLISYSLILGFMIYYFIIFIDKENPTIYFYNRYIKDTGNFPLNSSSVFHYLNLINNNRKPNITIDYDCIRIIGIEEELDYYFDKYNLSEYNHWVYGPCDYESDARGLNDLIDNNTFLQSACIKKYYDTNYNKYFDRNEKNFKWPILEHGVSSPNSTIYGIFIEKCQNDSLKNNCKSKKEIDRYLINYSISLNILDYYVDVLNYKNPFIRHIYNFINRLYINEILNLNHFYFNPSITKTYDGIFVENIFEEKSYSFTKNEKISINRKNTQIIVAFYFLMQNTVMCYERHYKKFQDFLSKIGGIGSFILLCGLILNYLVTDYIILLDTEELVLNIDEVNFKKNELIKKPTIYRKMNEILYPPKKKNNINNDNDKNNNINKKNQLQSSACPIFIKGKLEKNENNEIPNSEPFKSLFSKNRKYYNLYKQNNDEKSRVSNVEKIFYSIQPKNKNKNLFLLETQKFFSDNRQDSQGESIVDLEKINNKKTFYEIKEVDNGIINKPTKKQNFTWLNYICYLLSLKKNNSKISFFENFRAQIISEENLIQNHLDIYKLLKALKFEKINPFESKKLN